MIKISIIVPIYNIENYLVKCLDSLINQSYKNIEIILVDDGSTDNGYSICLKYKKKDKRIKLIHQENKGLSSARNTGLKYATGEFVWFIDGDDYIDNNSVDILLKHLDNDTDIVVFNYYKVSNKSKKMKGHYNFNNLDTKYILSFPSVWNKIFRRSILYDEMFPEGHIYEDVYVIPTLILNTKKIKFTEDYLYYYVYRKNSISNEDRNIEECKYVLNNVKDKLLNIYYDEVEYLYIYNLLLPNILKIKKIKKINKYLKNIFPRYYKNKYLGKKRIFFLIIYIFC